MTGLAILQALPALLAIIQTVSSTPLTFGGLHQRNESQPDDPVWPSGLAGLVHNKTWPNFTEETTRWSSYEAPTFDQVFLPETEEELSLGLQYMSSNSMPWLAKSGGHGYSPTLHSIQNAVLINLQNFNYVRVEDDGTAVVGTGTRFQDMVNIIGAAGRELTVGSCPCVGATGAMLGGGLGRLQGLHGLTSDALRKVRMALWNGTIVDASDKVNQDLFWGIRGSGQNYGIVIESTFETWPATNGGMHYNADMVFTKDSVGRIMEITNNLTTPALDAALSFVMFFASDAATSELTVIVNLVYAGPMEEGQKYTKLFSPFSLSLEENMIPWAELPTRSVLGLIPASCVTGPRYNLRSVIARTLDPQSFVEFSYAFEKFMQDYPQANGSAMMIETFPVQGIEALPDHYSAFPHRNRFRNMIESIGSYTDDSVAGCVDDFFREWRDRFAEPAVSGYDKLYVYQNYAHDDEPLSALYGYEKWRHKRLTHLKNTYDPHGFFNGYHAVPSDLAKWS
ncbi:hypothetical protein DL765_000232 [Monosporascus sp. GIB2]|nr:hypothetical protein DL765_000232 [Monosporascus sp. GIB2]